ncbi:hypothetical protein SNOG_00785 [Parastagonospora nodorum SN15]|uniref:Uncharacterized protein n=1 Tax=Phaeosphaeria nodorum (strain SN15 / ATCC MYA-4574 / FGSC 10173) TaxID=321614 RepID=Q0V5C9_PHANO|nr:hypothetical protein SNOG_00785 [Parastagonospora nodorum SN15]EAT92280.1 hypothetical protein SNOG_00785 [Parastagonospora nodorum SN15]
MAFPPDAYRLSQASKSVQVETRLIHEQEENINRITGTSGPRPTWIAYDFQP